MVVGRTPSSARDLATPWSRSAPVVGGPLPCASRIALANFGRGSVQGRRRGWGPSWLNTGEQASCLWTAQHQERENAEDRPVRNCQATKAGDDLAEKPVLVVRKPAPGQELAQSDAHHEKESHHENGCQQRAEPGRHISSAGSVGVLLDDMDKRADEGRIAQEEKRVASDDSRLDVVTDRENLKVVRTGVHRREPPIFRS